MVDKTTLEIQALAAALRPLGEIAAEIGFQKPLADYSRKEVLSLVEVIVDAWQGYLLKNSASQYFTNHLSQPSSQPPKEGVRPYA